MSKTASESAEALAVRTRELERRLALVEAILYEIIDLLPRERLQPRLPVLSRMLCELDGITEDFDGDMGDLEGFVNEVAP